MSLLQAKEEKEKQEKEVRLVEWAVNLMILRLRTTGGGHSRKRSSPLPLRSQAKEKAAKKEAERVADEKRKVRCQQPPPHLPSCPRSPPDTFPTCVLVVTGGGQNEGGGGSSAGAFISYLVHCAKGDKGSFGGSSVFTRGLSVACQVLQVTAESSGHDVAL